MMSGGSGMSLFGTVNKGTTGLVTFSKGLDVISNNVANMNTPGFKKNDLLFRDLFYQYKTTSNSGPGVSSRRDGSGVTDGGTTTNFSQGDIQQSGNQTDVAINGNGFFILRSDEGTFYSRVGQFAIDEEGFLVSKTNEARVAGIDSSGQLVDINIASLRVSPAQATTTVTFTNNLSPGSTEHVINNVEVFDALGNAHVLTLTLTNNSSVTPRSWLAEITNEDGDIIGSGYEIRFQGNGSPEVGYNSFSFIFSPPDADPMEILFFFGEPGTFTGATSFSAGANSDLAVDSQDGFGFGSQTGLSFNEDGILEIEYSNGETSEGGRLALAWLNDTQYMKQIGNGLFLCDNSDQLQIGAANEGMMGEIAGESLEISNVELSQEFTYLVIVQRGFQVSSQVVSIANEMIQQLLDSTESRR
jgi:flagellar hook protein FlgE